jgi:DHA1 family tetracycline resistance protein-like MFS transporter
MASGFLNLCTVCSTLTVRPILLQKFLGTDPTVIGATTANWLAIGSTLQLVVAPSMGKLSDSYGRKPVLIFGAVVSLALRILALANPTYLTIALEKIIPQAVNYYSQWAICNASFSDLTTTTEEQAGVFGKFMSWVGIGVLVSPLVSAQAIALTGE